MSKLSKLSKIGFGAYRISVKSEQHYQALEHALENNCNLIDTSANYTNGDSERLIGKLLEERPELNPFIITKAGYIQGDNLAHFADLNAQGLGIDDVNNISDDLKHSIHPDFLKQQLMLSLGRLRVDSIDCFLLHNPEYYFETEKANRETYYDRIKKAFECLEDFVDQGLIKYYGISSNTFPSSPESNNATDLNTIIEIANEVSSNHHLKFIQFPHNLVEAGAIQKQYDGQSLLDICKENNLTTLTNRPLNAFTDNGLLRLATYDDFIQQVNKADADKQFEYCMKKIAAKWRMQSGDIPDMMSVPLLKQLDEIWKTLPSNDAVDQVFIQHFFPFLAQIWGGNGLTQEEAAPFYKLYEMSKTFSKMRMSERADIFFGDLIQKGEIKGQDEVPLSVMAIEKYFNDGIDHVLLGMRRVEYVDQVKHLF